MLATCTRPNFDLNGYLILLVEVFLLAVETDEGYPEENVEVVVAAPVIKPMIPRLKVPSKSISI